MGPPKEKRMLKGKPPPVDKLIVPAIGIALAIVAYQFVRGILRAEVSGNSLRYHEFLASLDEFVN
jgi:hypothetical protein